MTREEQRAHAEYIPDGIHGIVTLGSGPDADPDAPDALRQTLTAELAEYGLNDVIVRTTGGLGLYSSERLIKVARPDMPTVLYARVTPELIIDIVKKHLAEGVPVRDAAWCQIPVRSAPLDGIPSVEDMPFFERQTPVISWRCGHIDAGRIDDVFRAGGYRTLSTVLNLSSEALLDTIEASQLQGHGGRGTTVSARWREAAKQPGATVLVCNALEVEPDSVKDRWLLEGDPHRIVEGMIIAARAVGASAGYIVLNPSYKRAQRRLEKAIAQARRHRRLGKGIRDTTFDFDVLVRTGPASFVAGEETALISYLEGGAGPRSTPPPVTVAGLHGQPTVVANVETLAHLTTLPFDASETLPVTRLYTLEGTPNAGVVEIRAETTVRELVCGMGGLSGENIKGVAIGGHLGGILPADLLDTPLTEASFRWLGIWPGAGLVSVLSDAMSPVHWLRDHLRFAAQESCGHCTPCREGTEQARRIVERLCDGAGQPQDLTLLQQLGPYIAQSSMCGYGHAVPGGLITALRYFGPEIRERIPARR